MDLVIDPDVQRVAEFMQQTIPASRLIGVAGAVNQVAPLLWGRHDAEPVATLSLEPAAISDCGQPKQSTASV